MPRDPEEEIVFDELPHGRGTSEHGILALLEPRRVLEIGAGVGLVLRALASRTDLVEYTATDFSSKAIDLLERLSGDLAARYPKSQHGMKSRRPAHAARHPR